LASLTLFSKGTTLPEKVGKERRKKVAADFLAWWED
jgi:hypothetical protein